MFFEQLDSHSLVLTVNSRLARYMKAAYDDYQKNKKNIAWQTPSIFPLQSWLEHQFHHSNSKGRYLLNAFQELSAWEMIIKQSKIAKTIPLSSLARLMQDAFELLTLWQVPLETLKPFSEQLETHCLITWILAFQKMADEKNWIVKAELPAHLIRYCDALHLPQKIMLMGFDEISPSVQSLFSLINKTCSISYETFSATASQRTQIILENTDTELKTMAQFAKSYIEKNPHAKIGCIIPDLQNKREKVLRIFTDIFCMEHLLPQTEKKPLPFNLSAGISLSTHPMIKSAISVLKWCCSSLPVENIYDILQSSYLCRDEDEKNHGALCDVFLRKQNKLELSISDLFFALSSLNLHHSTILSRWRTMYVIYRKTMKLKLMPSQWMQYFLQLLKAIAWPSQRTQSSEEFQLLERFKKLAHEFSTLDFMFSTLSYSNALNLLVKLIENTLFQTKSNEEPIQILGVLETSGILFDAIWVSGVNDNTWPPVAKPHPFIPHVIQQKFNLPNSTAKHALQFYKHITERLKNSANEIIFSSIAKDGDQHLSPSRLIQDIPIRDIHFKQEKKLDEKIFFSKMMEIVDDSHAAPLSDFSAIRGGTQILTYQALCPFRAFAAVRLKARGFHSPELGIPAKTKGTLVHQVLFELWGEFKNQVALNAMPEDALITMIKKYIDKAFEEQLSQRSSNKTNGSESASDRAFFSRIEKKRLATLIFNWLQLEKTRPDFTVLRRECAEHIMIEKLPLDIRVDRVDELSDGSLMIIDYKTNTNTINGWFQTRLTDLQLPLYAIFHDQLFASRYQGIAFGEIKSDNITLRGIIHENHIDEKYDHFELMPINKIKNKLGITTWKDLISSWKESLTQLSNDFCDGVAVADPIKQSTCQTCDLQTLCRYKLHSERNINAE